VRGQPVLGENGVLYVVTGRKDFVAELRSKVQYTPGSVNSQLVAVRADGSTLWRMSFDEQIWSGPVLGPDGTIYLATRAGNVYAIEPP
jgi:outer membrane protein assembly factor BamB